MNKKDLGLLILILVVGAIVTVINPRFLLRAIVQYDSSRERVLGDFLASYELSPGTVVHAGYGTLLEGANAPSYDVTARAFFFKASYLVRM